MTTSSPKRFPSSENTTTLVYLGTSMNPTLLDLDLVQFQPYLDDFPLIGDVIVIQRKEEPNKIIIHRIVEVNHEKVKTQGDNCDQRDSWILSPSDILGYVTTIRRGDRSIQVDRGIRYIQISLFHRIHRLVFKTFKSFSKSHPNRLMAWLVSKILKYRIVTFSGTNRSEYQLFLGPIYIGRLQKGSTMWEIKEAYRFIVDPTLFKYKTGDQRSDDHSE
jgi:hypothetical protein